MKKLIAILLSVLILLSFSACNDDNDDTNLEFGENGEINFPIIDA